MQKQRRIAYWLLIGVFLVIAMVVIGGITRLTHSGLSMVTWKPISGSIPPLNQTQWLSEFENYKTSPEYIKRNFHFTVDEFKSIFWWEYIHRLLGRIIGIVFLIPFLFFWKKGYFTDKRLFKNLIIIFLLGGLQGLIGWFMVKSGLSSRPEVSHFRLALHLSTAFFLCCYILWVALKIITPRIEPFNQETITIKKWIHWGIGITAIQIIYGAFVAGLKAGFFYPTYPLMGNSFIAPEAIQGIHKLGMLAFLETPMLVQFIHRWLAVFVVGMMVIIYVKAKKAMVSSSQMKAVTALLFVVCCQFLLGVFTLINQVPVSLGVLHQLGAIVLLVCLVNAKYRFTKKPYLYRFS